MKGTSYYRATNTCERNQGYNTKIIPLKFTPWRIFYKFMTLFWWEREVGIYLPMQNHLFTLPFGKVEHYIVLKVTAGCVKSDLVFKYAKLNHEDNHAHLYRGSLETETELACIILKPQSSETTPVENM